MKTLAFVFGLCISTVGAVGIVAPSVLVRLVQQFIASGAVGFYVIAVLRIAFGIILIAAAPRSRTPRALRILGVVILILGVSTALTGLLAVGQGREAIEAWLQRGSGVIRLTALPVLALGGFVAFVCAPTRRAA